MAEENKNQDPEERKKSSGSDDDFGLPDFEFEALDDDDDDSSSIEAPAASTKSAPEPTPQKPASDDVPSMDADDLEGLDLEDLGDLDLSDVGDLGDLNLDDLDLDDLDLGDLDKDLNDFKESDAAAKSAPVAKSAERIEDIFDKPKKSTPEPEKPASDDFADDGLFFEEESFDEFDMGSGGASDTNMFADKAAGGSDDFDSDIFGNGSSEPDLDISFDDEKEAEPIPFAKRPVESAYHVDDEEEEEVTKEEIQAAKGKFIRIVIFGIIMFSGLGFGFLYWNGNLTDGAAVSERAEKESESEPIAANDDSKKEEEVKVPDVTESTPDEPAKTEEKPTAVTKTEPKKEEPKPVVKKEEPKPAVVKKEEPKKETPPTTKTTTTKPKPTTTTTTKPIKPIKSTTDAIETLTAKTGQRHLIVASFLSSEAAIEHAKTLAVNGVKPVIIPPFDGAPNYRVSIVAYKTLNEALQNLEAYRQQYGNGVWVLRY